MAKRGAGSSVESWTVENENEVCSIVEQLQVFDRGPLGIEAILGVRSMRPSSRKGIRYLFSEHGYSTRRLTLRDRFRLSRKSKMPRPIAHRIGAALVCLIYVPFVMVVNTLPRLMGRGGRMYMIEPLPNAGPAAAGGAAGGDGSGPFGSGDREPRNPLSPLPAIGMTQPLP